VSGIVVTERTRRACGPYDHLVPVEQIRPEIIRQLGAGPRTLQQLARLLGYSESTVRRHLLDLEEEQRVHRRAGPVTQYRGKLCIWHIGARPLDIDLPREEFIGAGEMPRQETTCNYPAVGRRDPLVAALFGTACATGAM
jgi:DNA-binding CsgD family transcriptional regulator